jgi:hypothetical protein
MSVLEVGKTYLTRNGKRSQITGYDATTDTFFGYCDNMEIMYDAEGEVLNAAYTDYDIVDAVDDTSLEPGEASIPMPKNGGLVIQVGHAYSDRKGLRHIVERKFGTGFIGGGHTWFADGRRNAAVETDSDLVGDLGVVNPEPEARDGDPAQQMSLNNQADPIPSPPLPNEDLIKAVLAGETVQWKRPFNAAWEDLRNRAFALRMLVGYDNVPGVEFRMKPKLTVLWGVMCKGRAITTPYGALGYRDEAHALMDARKEDGITRKLLRIEIDDELNICDARTVKP